jgi:hypothetical protein
VRDTRRTQLSNTGDAPGVLEKRLDVGWGIDVLHPLAMRTSDSFTQPLSPLSK